MVLKRVRGQTWTPSFDGVTLERAGVTIERVVTQLSLLSPRRMTGSMFISTPKNLEPTKTPETPSKHPHKAHA